MMYSFKKTEKFAKFSVLSVIAIVYIDIVVVIPSSEQSRMEKDRSSTNSNFYIVCIYF